AEVLNGKYEIPGIPCDREVKVLIATSAKEVENKLQEFSIRVNEFVSRLDQRMPEEELERFKEELYALKQKAKHYKFIPIPARYGREQDTPFAFTPRKQIEELN